MEDILDKNNEKTYLTDTELFSKIWTSPRQVFKYINDKRYEKYLIILLALSGISRSFDRASLKDMGDQMSLESIIGLSIILGGLLGWISYYIYSALISWTGKWLNGKGDTSSIVRMFAYAMIPSIVSLIFLIPQIGIYGIEIYKEEGDLTSAGLIPNIIFYATMLFEAILGIWTMVLCVIGLSEVQKFSIGKSIVNLLLPIVVILVPIIILILLLKMF